MLVLDNVNRTVKDDLANSLAKGDKLSIAAACFSIYAYKELKKQLDDIEELRFVFTSPTFLREKAPKERREFYIPRLNRERSLYGTEFEVKLRNELTQKAIARECAEWIQNKVKYEHTSQMHYGAQTIHSGNLYQIFTYVKNKAASYAGDSHEVAGMLLYARTDEEIWPHNTYLMSGNRISVRTLDLNCDFEVIARQMNSIVEEEFGVKK